MNTIDNLAINSIRILSADAIQKANSGHPGLPLGSAPMAYELWAHHMNHNPANPEWANRDRFILSGGHGSMLLYSLLHLFGYGLTKEDLMNFRQVGSLTPGHPEYGHTVGVEATTGPLGAGMGMAVGMAMAEKHLASVFNKESYPVVDHFTYVLGGDGCMMEGISSEAFSLAGTLGLGKLIVLYDSNRISIEGSTDIAFRENVEERMKAFGFQTITVEDGTDIDAIGAAIEVAKADTEHPSFITIKTEIGFGCPAKQGKASAHGEPLGVDNIKAMRETLGWQYEEPFFVPEEVYEHYSRLAEEKADVEAAWNAMFAAYCDEYPEMEKLWEQYHTAPDAKSLIENEALWLTKDKAEATRSLSGKMINILKDIMPNMIGGSADLAPSNKTAMKADQDAIDKNAVLSKLAAMDETSAEYATAFADFVSQVQSAHEIQNGTNITYNSDAKKIDGTDSEILLNGIKYTSSLNTYTINGLSITALQATGAGDTNAISITTSTDTQGIYDKVKDFLTQYNALINEITSLYNADSAKGYEPLTDDEKDALSDSEVEKWEQKIEDSLLRRDESLEKVMNAMTSSMSKGYEVNGKTYYLSNFGIKTLGYFNAPENQEYAYHIDGDEDDTATSGNADKLMAMITSDPDTVISFMQQLTSGLYDAVGEKMKSSTLSSSYKVYNDKEMASEYSDYTDLIKKWEEKLQDKEDYYYNKFSAMETALSKLNSQTSSLSSLFGN